MPFPLGNDRKHQNIRCKFNKFDSLAMLSLGKHIRLFPIIQKFILPFSVLRFHVEDLQEGRNDFNF